MSGSDAAQPERRPRSELVLLLATTLVMQASLFMTRPMTSYRVLEIGGSGAHVGVVTACFSILPLLVAIPVGRVVDVGRGVVLLRLGVAGGVVGTVGIAFAGSVWQLAAANVVVGTSHLLNAVATQGLLSRAVGLAGQDRLFGVFTVMVSAGQLIGPPLASAVAGVRGMDSGGAAAAILVAAVLNVVGLVAALFVRSRTRRTGDGRTRHRAVSSRSLLGRDGMAPAVFASLTLLTCVDLVTSFLPVLATDRGIGVGAVGWLLALRAGASLVARLLIQRALVLTTRRRLLLVSMLVSGVLLVAITWFTALWLLAAFLAVAGFFLGVGQPLTMTWVVLLAGPKARGKALALRLAGNRLGQVTVPGLAAVVAGAAGATGVFWLMGGLLVVAAVPIARTTDPNAPGDAEPEREV